MEYKDILVTILLTLVFVALSISIIFLREKEKTSILQEKPPFPQYIKNYNLSLYEKEASQCKKFNAFDTFGTNHLNTSGTICISSINLQYFNNIDNKVFITLHKITEGFDAYKQYILSLSTKEKIYSYDIFRLYANELLWFSDSEYNLILVQEYFFDQNTSSANLISPSAGNPVTQYFLQNYPSE